MLPVPVALPGSQVVPVFRVTGGGGAVVTLFMPGTPVNGVPDFIESIQEAFLLDGRHLLQLTNFDRVDTYGAFVDANRRRAFLEASADPFGTNPNENCQLFSIGTLGQRLRQLTRFESDGRSESGCNFGPPPGCTTATPIQDSVTRTVVFYSSCDPFGTNPNGGQIFAMRPNGSQLRQLTDARGLTTGADGLITVELPGPFAYSGRPSADTQ